MATFKRDFVFNDEIMKTIAKNIRKYRKEQKITQEQLALDIDVSPEFYRRFESTLGKEGISLINVYKISVILNVRIDKFFEDDNTIEDKK